MSSARQSLPRHPVGFYVVCVAVFLERWAAAMLGSTVILMLCERYGHERNEALRLAGLFNATSYLATLPGGLAIDGVLDPRRALGLGTALLALGYAALTQGIPGAIWLAIPLLVCGHGLFKPSTQAMLARLYVFDPGRLDAAQIIFYQAVNAGTVIGALSAGGFVHARQWRAQFAVAAIVMLAGRIALALGKDVLRLPQVKPPALSSELIEPRPTLAGSRARAIATLTLAMMLYTIGFGQVEGSLFLWAKDRTDRVLCGFEIPAGWFVGLPALLVVLLAPAQLAVLPEIRRRMSTQRLTAWGLAAVALAFTVLIPQTLGSAGHRVSMVWLLTCMTLLVFGELLIAPLGLSTILRLTPRRFVGVVVGAWYVAGALGRGLAGEIGALWMGRIGL